MNVIIGAVRKTLSSIYIIIFIESSVKLIDFLKQNYSFIYLLKLTEDKYICDATDA